MAVWELKQGSQIQFLPQNPLECASQGVSNHRQHNIKAPHYWPFVTGMRFNVMATSWSATVFPAGMIGYWSFPRVINTMAINPRWGIYHRSTPYSVGRERGFKAGLQPRIITSERYRIIMGMGSANERRRYIVTPSLIDWDHTQDDPCGGCFNCEHSSNKDLLTFVYTDRSTETRIQGHRQSTMLLVEDLTDTL